MSKRGLQVERDVWTTEEFGVSYQGAVGALLADGTVPAPVYFDSASGPGGRSVSQWSVYDGRQGRPRAAVLRAVCSCGWAGPQHRLDWEMIGGDELAEAGDGPAAACERDWDGHTAEVAAQAVPLPEVVTVLLERLEVEIDKLTATSPVAALRAVRALEVLAGRLGYWAARGTRSDHDAGQAAAALGLSEREARRLMARLGGWASHA
ncbi:hypothetical protein [Streptomyces sp. NPDC093225]|uniref:hypothetical protein n=1 Tax=Streptomyces sp. NPDC093225 TaxID=3366034 RepID=UPI003810333D